MDAKRKRELRRQYQGSFLKRNKWRIIFTVVISIFIIVPTFFLFFFLHITDEYKETPLTYYESYGMNSGTYAYEVDGVEYAFSYGNFGFDGGQTINYDDTVWYSVKNPKEHVVNRPMGIAICLTIEGVMVIWVLAEGLRQYMKKSKRKRNADMKDVV